MVGLGAAPAVLQFGLLLFLPETPRWLFQNGHPGAARTVLGKVYNGSESMVEEVIRAMEQEILEEEAIQRLTRKSSPDDGPSSWAPSRLQTWTELFWQGGNRRALTIACLLQGLQQLCGFVRFSLEAMRENVIQTNHPTEFPHVFLGHHIFLHRILVSHTDIPLDRDHELPLHPRGLDDHRPHWTSPDPLNHPPGHDRRPPALFGLIPIPRPAHHRSQHHHSAPSSPPPLRSSPPSHSHPDRPRHLRVRLCHRAWQHRMATRRTVPLFGPFSRIQSRDGHELGQQFRGGIDIFTHDALLESHVDICHICRDMCPGLGHGAVDIPRNQRVGVRGGEGAFAGRMGRGRESAAGEKEPERGFNMTAHSSKSVAHRTRSFIPSVHASNWLMNRTRSAPGLAPPWHVGIEVRYVCSTN